MVVVANKHNAILILCCRIIDCGYSVNRTKTNMVMSIEILTCSIFNHRLSTY